jgi:hypothetical protein
MTDILQRWRTMGAGAKEQSLAGAPTVPILSSLIWCLITLTHVTCIPLYTPTLLYALHFLAAWGHLPPNSAKNIQSDLFNSSSYSNSNIISLKSFNMSNLVKDT